MPIRRSLKCSAGPNQHVFCERSGCKLNTNRHSCIRGTSRQRDCRMAAHVKRACIALQLGDQIRLIAERAYRRQCKWRKRLNWRQQQIDMAEQRIQAATKLHSSQQNLLIICGRDGSPILDHGSKHRPVTLPVSRKGCFMCDRCLDGAIRHPINDHLRGIRDRHLDDFGAECAKYRRRGSNNAASGVIDVILVPFGVDTDSQTLSTLSCCS